MIEILRETTKDLHPHDYYINKKSGKMVAFNSAPEYNSLKVFENPRSFCKRYRKFEKQGEVESMDDIAI
jgi:hypothetical protein